MKPGDMVVEDTENDTSVRVRPVYIQHADCESLEDGLGRLGCVKMAMDIWRMVIASESLMEACKDP